MKKLISTLTIVALSPLASFAGNADFIFGSAIGLGGALFANANTITLGYFVVGSTSSAAAFTELVNDPFGNPGYVSSGSGTVVTSNDPFGNPGYARGEFSVDGLPSAAVGQAMYIKLSADVGDAYITDSAWSVIAATNPPALRALNDATIGHANPEQISFAAAGLTGTAVTPGGVGGTGLTITVPEPSTASLIAGMLALGSVMLRRRTA